MPCTKLSKETLRSRLRLSKVARSVAFWERFAAFNKQGGGGETPSFLRTHPLDEVRIKDLKKRMPEARAQFQPAK